MAKKFLKVSNDRKLRIKLVQEEDGVAVKAVEEDGEDWFILTLNNDGTFTRHSEVVRYIGLSLDHNGIIIEKPE